MDISFVKYHGAGNDFILIDERKKAGLIDQTLISRLCDRHFGIGADGVIFLRSSKEADALMLIFNADGSTAPMCGNGLRCAAHFLSQLIDQRAHLTLLSSTGKHRCHINGSLVTANLGAPKNVKTDLKLMIDKELFPCAYLDTGAPHLVLFADDLPRRLSVEEAKALRSHPQFAPQGVNVNIAKRLGKKMWEIRTYERGVVGAETLACGTGAAAVSIAALIRFSLSPPIEIKCRSKAILQFDLFPSDPLLKEVQMRGQATPVFRGSAALLSDKTSL